MKLPAILATLTQEPLILTPSTHAALLTTFREHSTRDMSKREGVDSCGQSVELDQAEMVDGVMHIPVNGPIGRGLGAFEKGAGAIDVGDIWDDVEAADEDPNCRAIILHIDSPGGMYSGTPELADRIMQCTKPTAAFIPGMACSGGYWLASACDMVCATKSADIANIGVYCYLLDESKLYADAGLKPEVISSGEYKGMGAPGIPITETQRKHLQDRVNEMASTFYQHVQSVRPDVKLSDMKGQAFKSPAALGKGFIDMIVPDVDEVVALLAGEYSGAR